MLLELEDLERRLLPAASLEQKLEGTLRRRVDELGEELEVLGQRLVALRATLEQ